MSELALMPLHGLADSPKIPLPENGELVLGRDPGGSGVKIADPRCSRRHAAILARDGKLQLRDMGSKNGTFVNGKRVEDAVALHAGDHVRIGHAEFALVGPTGEYRCASCMETFIQAPPEAPFSTGCRRKFPLLGATLAGRRLVRGLGSGSFGSVYVGHRRGNPYVAVKVLHVEFTETPDVVMKFLKEAYATSGLEHDNMVRFGDSGHEGGHWYIILEYFPSESLRDLIEERGTMAAGRGDGDHEAGRRRAGVRARPAAAAPRREAGQHPRRRGRPGEGGRLRAGQAARRLRVHVAHADRHDRARRCSWRRS